MTAATLPHTAPESSRKGLFDGASAASWVALALLLVVGLYMYCDRHVITLQADPIKQALSLTDFKLGLLQGVGISIFVVFVGYPIAWLADRFDQRYILATCIAVWCAAVAASGMAQSFEQLFFASAVVGAGESGLLPICYAAIPELFKGRSRVLANSVVIVTGRIGSGIVIAGTGLVVQHIAAVRAWLPTSWAEMESWRLTFFALAVPGPLLAVAVLFIRLRPRAITTAAPERGTAKPMAAPMWPFLSRHLPLFAGFYIGTGLLVFGMSALGAFLPVVAMRQMSASPAQVGGWMGSATFASALVAMLFVLSGSSILQRWLGQRYTITLLAMASLIPALITPLMLFARTPAEIFINLGIGFIFLSAGSMAFPTALQELTPRLSRARLISIAIVINIILSAAAPVIVGAISDRLKTLANGLMLATVATATVGLLVSGILLLTCARHYAATVDAARNAEAREAGEPLA
jgi:MFS family permease